MKLLVCLFLFCVVLGAQAGYIGGWGAPGYVSYGYPAYGNGGWNGYGNGGWRSGYGYAGLSGYGNGWNNGWRVW